LTIAKKVFSYLAEIAKYYQINPLIKTLPTPNKKKNTLPSSPHP
jgi:hypothetical protein